MSATEQRMITFEAPSPTTGHLGLGQRGSVRRWRHGLLARHQPPHRSRERAPFSSPSKLEREVAERTRVLHEVVDELRRSRARYSAIFEHSPVDLVVQAVQPDGRLVCEDANPAWERHSGYPRDFVVGRSLEEILPPEQAEFATMQYRRAIETREPVEYEYSAQFPIGEVSRRSFLVPLPGPADASSTCCWPPST